MRAVDMLARVGGEEFVLVLPNTSVQDAELVVAKLQGATPLGQTVSAGRGRNRVERALSSAV
ncbi:MAG TPA: diguanylate cyclase [Acidothermaceae bacterium]